MLSTAEYRARLELAMNDAAGIIVPKGRDDDAYFESLRESIRAALCQPFTVVAIVENEDFSGLTPGQSIVADVVAHADGYWLAYQPETDNFYCFWGSDPARLGAYREGGSALFVWWD